MNAQSMLDLVKRRVPGYTDTEYLSELNTAYNDVWAELVNLDDTYNTSIREITVATQSADFDLLYNADSRFTGAALPLFLQALRVRVLALNSNIWSVAIPSYFGDEQFKREQSNSAQNPATAGPYYYLIYGKGNLRFGRPLPVGTKIEITYEFWHLDLALVSAGTVTSTSTAVVGTSTKFTELLPPDFVSGYKPSATAIQESIAAEIIVAARTFEVVVLTSNTALTLRTAPPVDWAAAAFVLATTPVLPLVCHSVICDLATRNILSAPAEDERFDEWAAIAGRNVEKMVATLLTRQRQRHARKQRFPYGARRVRQG